MHHSESAKWLIDFQGGEGLPLLFCFSYAGGSAEFYRLWQPLLSGTVTVCPVELPGHGRRIAEPYVASIAGAAQEIARIAADAAAGPFFLFGHSLGSVMAYETAKVLEERGTPPEALIVSGRFPPHLESGRHRLHEATEEVLVAELQRLGGTPDEVLRDQNVRDVLLPIVRDDFRLMETHDGRLRGMLSCPVHACCGEDDPDATPASPERWADVTSGPSSVAWFPGDHFYIRESSAALARRIAAIVDRPIRPGADDGAAIQEGAR